MSATATMVCPTRLGSARMSSARSARIHVETLPISSVALESISPVDVLLVFMRGGTIEHVLVLLLLGAGTHKNRQRQTYTSTYQHEQFVASPVVPFAYHCHLHAIALRMRYRMYIHDKIWLWKRFPKPNACMVALLAKSPSQPIEAVSESNSLTNGLRRC